MTWDLSCRDWEERLAQGRSLVPDLPLDMAAAERAVRVFNELRLPDVIGTPALGEAGGEWFRAIVRALFGSFVDGERMVRELFWLVSKKNSKTTNGGALMMTASLLSLRPRAEFLFVGATQTLADIGFGQALGMVQADNDLHRRVHVQEHIKRITVRESLVRLMIKTFDESILTGVKLSGGIMIDEVHLLGKVAKAAAVIRQIRGGMVPYPESFLAFVSTQSEEQPAGVFLEELTKARAIRDGRQQGRMLPVLYEFPERMLKNGQWRDRAFWHWVNPNVGRSITIERLAEDYAGAVEKGDAALRAWASQHLNVEIGVALRSNRWEGAPFWQRCGDAELTLDELLARCEVVVVGLDGGGLDDLLGLCIAGRDRETRDWLEWHHAWAFRGDASAGEGDAEGVLERRKQIAASLLDFEREGTLTFYDVPGEDTAAVAALVKRVADAGLLPEKKGIGVDPVGISEIVDALVEIGLSVETELEAGCIVGIAQGWTLSNTIKTSARRLAAGTIRHGGTRLMNWCVGNAKVEPRGNAVTITKQTAGSAKIDPLMAGFNAEALLAKNPEAAGAKKFIYAEEGRELRFV